jgi:hypothetical protein
MRLFLKFVSYLFHPVFIPVAGTLAYFIITPKYSPLELQSGNILPIFILTVIIPIISYLILRNMGLVHSIFLQQLAERKIPLAINMALLLMIILKVIPNNYTVELYYYFVGLLAANAACLLLVFLGFKASLHLIGIGSFFMFLISLSIHFEINIIIAISFVTVLIGLIASSRLFLHAHSRGEVVIGLMIGLISQLLTLKFWL